MIRCPRCTGLTITQYEETRCLLCGWYFNPPLDIPMREAYARKGKCLDCQSSVEAGYVRCAEHRAYQKQYAAERASREA